MNTLGIIAGKGDLPHKVIAACREQERPYLVVTLSEEGNLSDFNGSPHVDIPIAKVGQLINKLLESEVNEVVMVGHVRRPIWHELVPDTLGMKLLAKILAKKLLGDDAILRTVTDFLEQQGIKVVGVDSILSGLLSPAGVIGRERPDTEINEDIRMGTELARRVGEFDIGQGVIVHRGQVLGIEAAEGTDALIQRCAQYRKELSGGVLVKMKKPQQERRVDLPTIGIHTIERANEAGLRAIAVEAGGSLIIDREQVIAKANQYGIVLVGVD